MKNGGGGNDGMNNGSSESPWKQQSTGRPYHAGFIDHSDFENHHCKQLMSLTAQNSYSMLKSAINNAPERKQRAANLTANSRFSSCNEFTFGINFKEEKTSK